MNRSLNLRSVITSGICSFLFGNVCVECHLQIRSVPVVPFFWNWLESCESYARSWKSDDMVVINILFEVTSCIYISFLFRKRCSRTQHKTGHLANLVRRTASSSRDPQTPTTPFADLTVHQCRCPAHFAHFLIRPDRFTLWHNHGNSQRQHLNGSSSCRSWRITIEQLNHHNNKHQPQRLRRTPGKCPSQCRQP